MPSSQRLHSPGLLHTAHSPGTWAWGSSVLFNRVSDPHPADVSDIRQQACPPAAVFLWLITSQSTSLHLRLFPRLVENGTVSGTSTYSNRNSIDCPFLQKTSQEETIHLIENPLIYMWAFVHL